VQTGGVGVAALRVAGRQGPLDHFGGGVVEQDAVRHVADRGRPAGAEVDGAACGGGSQECAEGPGGDVVDVCQVADLVVAAVATVVKTIRSARR
jgi:hypothetical protein